MPPTGRSAYLRDLRGYPFGLLGMQLVPWRRFICVSCSWPPPPWRRVFEIVDR